MGDWSITEASRSTPQADRPLSLGTIGLAMAALMLTLSSCKAPPRTDASITDERPERVTDPVPYQKDIACSALRVHDKGPTPVIQIDQILPGRLAIGLKADDLQSRTEWAVQKSYMLDGAQWHYLQLKAEPGDHRATISAQAIDLDLNGTLDWIQIQAGDRARSKQLLSRAERLSGGRISTSSYRTRAGCSYDRRSVYSPSPRSYTDAELGEAAYCAARMACSISEGPLCSKQISSPVLIIDQRGSYTSMTLQGHGSFRPAHPGTFITPSSAPACHSFAANRGYL